MVYGDGDGVWRVVCGVWHVMWCMAYGVQYMACGVWCSIVVYGVWCMVCGMLWCAAWHVACGMPS